MSSDSSITVRAGSEEPPAKRQKTFDCGPDAVWFKAKDNYSDSFEIVAVVSRSRLSKIYPDMSDVATWSGPNYLPGVQIGTLKFSQNADVVRFLAHWTYERNAKAALESCLPEGESWLELFCNVLVFCCEENIHHDVHDSLMDCLINRIQCQRRDGTSVAGIINSICSAVTDQEEEREEITAIADDTYLPKLLAILHVHHLRSDLLDEPRDFRDEQRELTLLDDIKSHARPIMHRVFDEGSLANVPKDSLADSFDQHCLYHQHKKQGTCYKQKES
ncbi:hypothetical protein KCU71_g4175, partial [Aureobasidium melanogenum]